MVKNAINDPLSKRPNRTPEVIMDPAFDVSLLDRPDLQLLGEVQEAFVKQWSAEVADRKGWLPSFHNLRL